MGTVKHQKRWHTEEEILKAIDRNRRLQGEYCAEGERLAAEADSCLRMANDDSLPPKDRTEYDRRYREAHEDSQILFGRADRKEAYIRELGHKLAAFRTETLSFTTDRAVV